MKFIFIAKCDNCGKGEMVELDDRKDGGHYPDWYAKQNLGYDTKNNKVMCKKCLERYDELIKEQTEARKNFK